MQFREYRRVPPKSGTFGTSGTFESVYAGGYRFEAEVQSGTFEVSTGTFGTFEPIKVPLLHFFSGAKPRALRGGRGRFFVQTIG